MKYKRMAIKKRKLYPLELAARNGDLMYQNKTNYEAKVRLRRLCSA